MLPRALGAAENVALSLVPLTLIVGVALPLGFVLLAAFTDGNPGDPNARLTLDSIIASYTDPELLEALLNSIQLGLLVGGICLLVALPFSWLLTRTDLPMREGLGRLMVISFYVSPLLLAMAWAALGAPTAGYLNVFWRTTTGFDGPLIDIFSFPGIVFVSVLHFIPLTYLLVSAGLRSISGTLEEAARLSRASQLRTYRAVTLPLLLPAVLAALFQVSVFAAEQFAVPWFLGVGFGYRTLPTEIYRSVSEFTVDYNRAAAAGTMLLWFAILGLFLYRRLLRRSNQYATVAGRFVQPRTTHLGAARWPCTGLVVGYLVLAVGLPTVALAWGSINAFPSPRLNLDALTLGHWSSLLADPRAATAIANSLIVALLGASLTAIYCVIVSFVVLRTRRRGRRLADYASSLPIAIPGLVLGLGFLWFYARSPLPLYGTLLGLGLAYAIRYIGHGVRITTAGLVQVHSELIEAATLSRASTRQLLTGIVLPLLRPSVLAAWIVLFVLFLQELNVTILVHRQTSITVPVYIFTKLGSEVGNSVYPVALLLLSITLLAAWLIGRQRDGRAA